MSVQFELNGVDLGCLTLCALVVGQKKVKEPFACREIARSARFATYHRRIIMVRGSTLGRCACLAKRKAKKSAKKKAKRSVKKKVVKPKKKLVEPAPKVTMPELPPPTQAESMAPPVEPTPSEFPPSESGNELSS